MHEKQRAITPTHVFGPRWQPGTYAASKEEPSQSIPWGGDAAAGSNGGCEGFFKPALGKRQNHPSAERQHQRDGPMAGPMYCKMLVPNHIAGAIIGRRGNSIGEIEMVSNSRLQMSPVENYFPGTQDRIFLMGGTMKDLEDCITQVLTRLRDISEDPGRCMLTKLVVPSSSCSAIIGKNGDNVKKLVERTGCKVNISPRVEELQERVVNIVGQYEGLLDATMTVVKTIQEDEHLKEHLALAYDVELPLGAWAGLKTEPSDPSVPLMPPAEAAEKTKREMIDYLRKAAPQKILLKYRLLGNIKNTMKAKGVGELHDAIEETWLVRGGDQASSESAATSACLFQPDLHASSTSPCSLITLSAAAEEAAGPPRSSENMELLLKESMSERSTLVPPDNDPLFMQSLGTPGGDISAGVYPLHGSPSAGPEIERQSMKDRDQLAEHATWFPCRVADILLELWDELTQDGSGPRERRKCCGSRR